MLFLKSSSFKEYLHSDDIYLSLLNFNSHLLNIANVKNRSHWSTEYHIHSYVFLTYKYIHEEFTFNEGPMNIYDM